MISLTVVAGRLIAALFVGEALGLFRPTLTMLGLVFAIAIVYEGLRSVKPPADLAKPTPAVIAIWCTVGLGYGVRAGLGFTSAGVPITKPVTWIGIACFIVFGIMFVLLTWVLEAASCCYTDFSGAWHVKSGAVLKAHLMALLMYVPISPKYPKPSPLEQEPETRNQLLGTAKSENPADMTEDGRMQRILEPRGRLLTPWNLAFAASAALGGSLGLGLDHTAPTYVSEGLALSLGFAAAAILASCHSRLARLVTIIGATIVGFGVASQAAAWPYTVLAVCPWLAIALLYFFFRGSSYYDLKQFGPNLLKAISSTGAILGLGKVLLRVVVGESAWQAAEFRDKRATAQPAAGEKAAGRQNSGFGPDAPDVIQRSVLDTARSGLDPSRSSLDGKPAPAPAVAGTADQHRGRFARRNRGMAPPPNNPHAPDEN
jgi:hypothetical protein